MLFWKLTFFHNSAFTICTFDADSFMHGSFCWQSISTLYCYYFYALLPPPSIQVGMHIILSHAVIWPVFTLLTLQSSHTRSPTMSAGARHPAAVCVCVCVCVCLLTLVARTPGLVSIIPGDPQYPLLYGRAVDVLDWAGGLEVLLDGLVHHQVLELSELRADVRKPSGAHVGRLAHPAVRRGNKRRGGEGCGGWLR